MKIPKIILAVFVLTALAGCRAQNQPAATPHPSPQVVTLTGVLTLLRNGETRYYLNNAQGQAARLLFSDAVLTSAGGPLAIDRQDVSITGEIVSENPTVIQVTSIQIINK